jgi:hypothetical protein
VSSLRTKDTFKKGIVGGLLRGRGRKKRKRRSEDRRAAQAGRSAALRQEGLAARTPLQSSTPGSAQQRTLLGG